MAAITVSPRPALLIASTTIEKEFTVRPPNGCEDDRGRRPGWELTVEHGYWQTNQLFHSGVRGSPGLRGWQFRIDCDGFVLEEWFDSTVDARYWRRTGRSPRLPVSPRAQGARDALRLQPARCGP